MPRYDYRCNDCGHEFEAEQRMVDAPLRECPKCAGEVQRLLSGANAIVKGGGAAPTCAEMSQCGMTGGPPCCGPSCGMM